MTLDETPRPPASGAGHGPRNPPAGVEGKRVERRHGTRHELERYAGLFASRTQVMKSSAMRDLMAITARPEVISLAGGLPDTSWSATRGCSRRAPRS